MREFDCDSFRRLLQLNLMEMEVIAWLLEAVLGRYISTLICNIFIEAIFSCPYPLLHVINVLSIGMSH